jgi:hypothetical protein
MIRIPEQTEVVYQNMGSCPSCEPQELGIIDIPQWIKDLFDDPVQFFVNKVVPDREQALPMTIGGTVLVAIGSRPRFRGTIARPALLGVGGILLGLGVLPFILKK